MRHRRVAPVHAAIVNDGSKLLALDLMTPNGTLVNGLKIECEQLNDGDTLTCFPWEFRVEIRQAQDAGDADVHPFELDPSPHVVALEHLGTGRVLQPTRDVCIIGRRHGCDITLSDNRVSRVHALLLNYFGRPAVFDLLSRNETSVNDELVQFRLLRDGDVVSIGETRFRAKLVESVAAGRAAGLKVPSETTIELNAEEQGADMIDIQATESSQRWRIAERLEKAARKR